MTDTEEKKGICYIAPYQPHYNYTLYYLDKRYRRYFTTQVSFAEWQAMDRNGDAARLSVHGEKRHVLLTEYRYIRGQSVMTITGYYDNRGTEQ